MVVYGAVLMVWPYTLQRFLDPLLPYVITAIVVGVNRLTAVRRRWQTPALVVVAVLFAVGGLTGSLDLILKRRSCDRASLFPSARCLADLGGWDGYFAAAHYVRERVPPDAIFATFAPATLFYSTGHRAAQLTPALGGPSSQFVSLLRQYRVSYLLLAPVTTFSDGSPPGGTPFAEMIRANCRSLRLEASFADDSYVFRLPPSDEGAIPDSVTACRAADAYVTRYRGHPRPPDNARGERAR
jgi:hypothetical protein